MLKEGEGGNDGGRKIVYSLQRGGGGGGEQWPFFCDEVISFYVVMLPMVSVFDDLMWRWR